MKLSTSIALSFALGVLFSLLPFQIRRSEVPMTVSINDQEVVVPPVTWLNFFKYPTFYESLKSACPVGILIVFAPLLLLLQWHFFRGMKGSAIVLTIEGLALIAGTVAALPALLFSHANWMTGYTQWRYTPLTFAIPLYGILTGIVCIAWPWVPRFQQTIR